MLHPILNFLRASPPVAVFIADVMLVRLLLPPHLIIPCTGLVPPPPLPMVIVSLSPPPPIGWLVPPSTSVSVVVGALIPPPSRCCCFPPLPSCSLSPPQLLYFDVGHFVHRPRILLFVRQHRVLGWRIIITLQSITRRSIATPPHPSVCAWSRSCPPRRACQCRLDDAPAIPVHLLARPPARGGEAKRQGYSTTSRGRSGNCNRRGSPGSCVGGCKNFRKSSSIKSHRMRLLTRPSCSGSCCRCGWGLHCGCCRQPLREEFSKNVDDLRGVGSFCVHPLRAHPQQSREVVPSCRVDTSCCTITVDRTPEPLREGLAVGPHVGFESRSFSTVDLRSPKLFSAPPPKACRVSLEKAQSKVSQNSLPLIAPLVQKNVLGFDVAMNDSFLMQILQG
mmetsp:Transcript_24841/g.52902  ORF Transcript_24841/g.52902 Transcript_24841/m.52902 type:complete len:392 (-) Transcript_24841:487-1662(-)